jgi:hypothetical protein
VQAAAKQRGGRVNKTQNQMPQCRVQDTKPNAAMPRIYPARQSGTQRTSSGTKVLSVSISIGALSVGRRGDGRGERGVQGRCGGDAGGCAGGGFGLSLSGGARRERAVERLVVVLDAMPSGKARGGGGGCGGGGGGGGEGEMALNAKSQV